MTMVIKVTHDDKTVQKWQVDFKTRKMGMLDGDNDWVEQHDFDFVLHGKIALLRIKIDRKEGKIDIKANHEQLGYSV